MQYNLKLFLSTILLSAIVRDVQTASGWRIPLPFRRSIQETREVGRSWDLEVSGFGALGQYVCPNNIDRVRTGSWIDSRDATVVTIPKDQLQPILQQIRLLEMEIVSLIEMEFDMIDSERGNTVIQSVDGALNPSQAVVVTVTSDIWSLVIGGANPGTTLQESPNVGATTAAAIFLESIPPVVTSIDARALSSVVESALQVSIPNPANSTPTSTPLAENDEEDEDEEDNDGSCINGTSICTQLTMTTTIQKTITTEVLVTATSTLGNSNVASPSTVAGIQIGCNQDSCLQALNNAQGKAFCSTFTAGIVTATTQLPSYLSACASDNSAIIRASSACSCLKEFPAATSARNVDAPSTTETVRSISNPVEMTATSSTAVDLSPQGIPVNISVEGGQEAQTSTVAETITSTENSAGQETFTGGIFIDTQEPSSYPSTVSPVAANSTSYATAQETVLSTSTDVVSTGYVFNALSSSNVAVYFGQTGATSLTSLAEQCADASIDIVILSFVIAQLDGGIYPSINFGAACGGQTTLMESEAPGLLSCPQLAAAVQKCQSTNGKKVLLSIGGAASQISFSSATQASNFADVLWKLFGPIGSIDMDLRPLGKVTIDGFDVDNEDNLPSYYNNLASTFRTHFASTSQKTYYLSSAPQCPYPDASNPMTMLLLCDFVYVQFYNNPQCEIGSTGFEASVKQWSTALAASTLTVKPRLYVGAPSFSAAGSTAYAKIGSAEGMENIAKEVKGIGITNLGGVMFWDGSEGLENVEGGKDIITWAKQGLL